MARSFFSQNCFKDNKYMYHYMHWKKIIHPFCLKFWLKKYECFFLSPFFVVGYMRFFAMLRKCLFVNYFANRNKLKLNVCPLKWVILSVHWLVSFNTPPFFCVLRVTVPWFKNCEELQFFLGSAVFVLTSEDGLDSRAQVDKM